MQSRADIDPVDIRYAIGNVILIDVIDGEPLQFRIRLHGTNLAERVRFDLTGGFVARADPPRARPLSRVCTG